MQELNQSGRNNFSERTEELAHRLRCSLRDLAAIIGISQAMLFAYRSGKHEPTLKAWRKLEKAEMASKIRAHAPISTRRKTENSANPKDFPAGAGEKDAADATLLPASPWEDQVRQLREDLAKIQAAFQSAPFTLAELEARMEAAGAWPASPADKKLMPGILWQKYGPQP